MYFQMLKYFWILIIPTIVIGFFVYYANLSLHKHKLLESLRTQLSFSSGTIESQLRTTEKTAINFFLNETVQQHLVPAAQKSPREAQYTSSIVHVLAAGRNIINDYIDDVFVYVDDQFVYRGDGVEDYHDFFGSFNVFDSYDEAFWTSQRRATGLSFEELPPDAVTKSFISSKSSVVVPLVFKQYVRGEQAVMVITVSTSQIVKTLTTNSQQSTQFFVTDYQGRLIASSVPPPMEASAYDEAYFHRQYDSDRYLVVSSVSDHGWIYYSVTSRQVYYEQASGILLVTSWFCVLLFIVGMILSFVFSRRLYTPVRAIMESRQEQDIFSNLLLDNALHHILQGHRVEHYGQVLRRIDFHGERFAALGIQFHFKEQLMDELAMDQEQSITGKLRKILEATLRIKVQSRVLEIRSQLYVAMVNLRSDEDRRKLEECARLLLDTFQYDLRYCRIVVSIGHVYDRLQGFGLSFDDARVMLLREKEDQEFQVLQAPDGLRDSFMFSSTDENRLHNALKAKNADSLRQTLRGIIQVNLDSDISGGALHLLLIKLYGKAIQIVHDKGFHVSQFVNEEQQRILNGQVRSIGFQEHIELLTQFYERLLQMHETPEENKPYGIVQQIIVYIEAHYKQDIYLDSISEAMKLSPKYVSRIFKEVTGQNLTDYIAVRRIAEAKRLLAESDMKNDEIALEVGIASRATFFRLFKRYEGVTPQEYRSSLPEK